MEGADLLSIAGGGSASFAGASDSLGTTVTDGGFRFLICKVRAMHWITTWNLTSGGGHFVRWRLSPQSGTISVDGAGSTMTMAAAKTLRILATSVGATTGVTNVTNDSSLMSVRRHDAAQPTTAQLQHQRRLRLDPKTLNNSGGTINFTAGSLSYLGNLTVGTAGLLEQPNFNADRQLKRSSLGLPPWMPHAHSRSQVAR